jgi:4-hydroxy-3-methylbut-2-enyl diphosphate reductase
MDQQHMSLAVEPRAGGIASRPPLRVLLAAPRGFCAGVRRAIEGVEAALERYGAPVYVRRPIVHNLAVVRDLEAKGAIFVEELDEVPDNSVVIMSAHGIPQHVVDEANGRALSWFDAVCPLVAKVHREVRRHHGDGRHVILIGHAGHPEIAGTLGQLPAGAASVVGSADDVRALRIADDRPVAYAVQTTYSVDESTDVIAAVKGRFTDVAVPPHSDICYATTNRQAAIRQVATMVDAIIVAGENFSSNACRLAEVGRAAGCDAVQLVADPADIDFGLLDGARSVGITAAASTPESTVMGIVATLAERYDLAVEESVHLVEQTVFKPVRIV